MSKKISKKISKKNSAKKSKTEKVFKYPISQINSPDYETTWGTLAIPEAFMHLNVYYLCIEST